MHPLQTLKKHCCWLIEITKIDNEWKRLKTGNSKNLRLSSYLPTIGSICHGLGSIHKWHHASTDRVFSVLFNCKYNTYLMWQGEEVRKSPNLCDVIYEWSLYRPLGLEKNLLTPLFFSQVNFYFMSTVKMLVILPFEQVREFFSCCKNAKPAFIYTILSLKNGCNGEINTYTC